MPNVSLSTLVVSENVGSARVAWPKQTAATEGRTEVSTRTTDPHAIVDSRGVTDLRAGKSVTVANRLKKQKSEVCN